MNTAVELLQVLSLLAAQSSSVPSSAVQSSSAQGGASAPVAVAHARTVTLTELRTTPARYLGEEVSFTLQFQQTIDGWNPFLSRFEPEAWLGFAAWADETLLWNAVVFDDPARRLFVRRGGELAALLGRAHTYQRFEVRALVQESFLGEPWLEVLALTPLEGETGAGTLVHIGRARDLVGQGQFDLALEQYERARSAPLPPHALAAILKEILDTREAQRFAEAQARARGQPKSAPRQ